MSQRSTPPSPTGDGPAPQGVPHPSLWGRLLPRARHADPPPGAPTGQAGPAPDERARAARITPAQVSQSAAARRIAAALAALLAAVIAVAFRGSWTSQSDAALAAHFDPWGAWLYPFAPDGLIVLALVGAVVLRHQARARLYCLAVVVLFTITSYVVNHLHGTGTFVMVGQGENATLKTPLEGWMVGLIAGQLVGAIAFGSHILMHVFRHLFPQALDGIGPPAGQTATVEARDTSGHLPGGVPEDPESDREIRKQSAAITVRMLLDAGVKPTRKRIATAYGISDRQAGYVISDVEAERDAEPEQPGAVKAAEPPPGRAVLAANGTANGHPAHTT